MRITEKKVVDVKTSTCTNPIYLGWHYLKGGQDYWLFEGNRSVEETHQIVERFIKPYQSVETTLSTSFVVQKAAGQSMTLQASHLTDQQYEGLKNILSSVKVEILLNKDSWEAEGALWQEVTVLGSSNTTETDETLKTLIITIELQSRITLRR